MQTLLDILKEHGGPIPFTELFGAMSAKLGTTKNTLWSYLEALKAEGKIDYPVSYPVWGGKENLTIRLCVD